MKRYIDSELTFVVQKNLTIMGLTIRADYMSGIQYQISKIEGEIESTVQNSKQN